jgi:hypothetical protein
VPGSVLKATCVCSSVEEAYAAAKFLTEANIMILLGPFDAGYVAGEAKTRPLRAKVLHAHLPDDETAEIEKGMSPNSDDI